jgi:hypothetical protein
MLEDGAKTESSGNLIVVLQEEVWSSCDDALNSRSLLGSLIYSL